MSKNKYSNTKIDGITYKYRDEILVGKKVPVFKDIASYSEIPFLNKEAKASKFYDDNEILIQRDLAYGSCIYVSEGENANGAYFLRDELIKARKSPILKPVDIEHNSDIIIGVMYDSALATQSGTIIQDDEITMDEKTSKFSLIKSDGSFIDEKLDIITNFVLYKYMFPEVVNEITAHQFNEKNSKYFVSMEVFYNEFGYIFNRDEASLIKIGNTLEGKELYNRYEKYVNKMAPDGRHVSKVYFNFTFGGVGIVEQPANKRSFLLDLAIKNNGEVVVGKVAEGMDTNTHTNSFKNLSEGEEMLTNEEKVAIDKLVNKAMASDPELRVDEARIGVLEKRIEDLTKDNAELKVKLDSASDKIEVMSTEAEKISNELVQKAGLFDTDLASKEGEINKLREDLAKAVEELTLIKQSKLGFDRISELETAGVKFGERKDDVISRVSKMSDEDYASYKEDMLSVLSTFAKCGEDEKTGKKMDEKEKEEDPKKVEKKAKADDEEDDDDDVEEVEEIAKPDLNVDSASAEEFATATATASKVDLSENYDKIMADVFKTVTTRDKNHLRGNNTIF